MGFTLLPQQLYSRATRLQVGARAGAGNLLQKVVQAGKQIANVFTWGNLRGFLIGAALAQIPSLVFSLSGLWSLFTNAALELYYFDWNIPDDRLDMQAKNRWIAFGGILGGTAGTGIGFFACGIVPSTSLFAFDERLAAYVLKEVGQEAFEELTFEMAYVLRLSFRNLARQTAGWLYKGARRWLKDPKNPLGNMIFGSRAEDVRKNWGEANAPSWSFAQAVEEKVETIPSLFWQNFTEELIEESIDACIEAGYVLSNSVEGYYAQQKLSASLAREAERIVEITPNRQNESETIVLAGPEDHLRGQIPAVLASHQMVESRDVGMIVGQPINDYLRPRPFEGIRLQFQMMSQKSPPYRAEGRNRLVRVALQVPDVPRARLDWQRLLFACGGRNGYLWGRYRARAVLEGGRHLTIYAGTPQEAEDRLRAFLFLSTREIRTLTITEEKREGERLVNPQLFKETTRVYPAYVTVINRQRTLARDQGKGSVEGQYIERRARIDLWRNTEPPDFEEVIRELLRRAD